MLNLDVSLDVRRVKVMWNVLSYLLSIWLNDYMNQKFRNLITGMTKNLCLYLGIFHNSPGEASIRVFDSVTNCAYQKEKVSVY